jgi:hypothetical protein
MGKEGTAHSNVYDHHNGQINSGEKMVCKKQIGAYN